VVPDCSQFVIQHAGQGRLEAHPPGDLDGARFEGRFVFWGVSGPHGAVFGEDVSLFDGRQVAKTGRDVRAAYLVAIRSGYALEGFSSSDPDGGYVGHTFGRASAKTRLQVFFDAAPDGSRSFSDRESFTRGELVATYRAEEYFQMDTRAAIFDTRVLYSLLDSRPFTLHGVTVDLGALAPHMVENSHGHNPEPGVAEPIPHQEPPFAHRGPGTFAERFAVGGMIVAADQPSPLRGVTTPE
jgi:hypothetical protein